ncbi:MAG: hypothetical protein Q4G68_09295 [Planctomycetia bacterium]|nr:hypothetical protein [Planctomycetia bacterium]
MFKQTAIFFLVLFTVCLGCSQNVKVNGKVTFADDDSPLTCGSIVFDDGKVSSKAQLNEDGTYKLGFEKEGNGIPKGEYDVYIIGAMDKIPIRVTAEKNMLSNLPEDEEGMDSFKMIPLIAEKYQSGKTSGLHVTIDGSSQQFDFTVERP